MCIFTTTNLACFPKSETAHKKVLHSLRCPCHMVSANVSKGANVLSGSLTDVLIGLLHYLNMSAKGRHLHNSVQTLPGCHGEGKQLLADKVPVILRSAEQICIIIASK